MKVIDERMVSSIFKIRGREGHKGMFGNTAVFAGSHTYVGAAYFVSEAAIRSGSGLVTLFVFEEILEIMKIKLNEEIVKLNPFVKKDNIREKISSIVFGSGMGRDLRTLEVFMNLKDFEIPLVIDADGLNILADDFTEGGKLEYLKRRKSITVLTPHMGEFSRLTRKSIEEIKKDREKIAIEFAERYGIILILKDSSTIITDGKDLYVNNRGNSSMSNGGMGDILAGLIGSLISQGYSGMEAGILGAYILGETGEELSKTRFIVNPRDVLEEIPKTMKRMENGAKIFQEGF